MSGRRPSHLLSCCITRRTSPGMETYSRQGPQRSYTTDSSRVFRPFSVQHSFSYDFLKSCSHSGHRVPPTSPVRKGTSWRSGSPGNTLTDSGLATAPPLHIYTTADALRVRGKLLLSFSVPHGAACEASPRDFCIIFSPFALSN